MRRRHKMDFIDRYNALVGAAVAVLSAVLGVYWYLFAGYLVLNVLDWLTGWYRSWKLKQESSRVGLRGVLKKLGYWVIIIIAFMLPTLFVHFAMDAFGKDLSVLVWVGWLTLAMLIVNEIRSIIENLVETGYNVPNVLIKGLAITEKMLKKADILPEVKEHENESEGD